MATAVKKPAADPLLLQGEVVLEPLPETVGQPVDALAVVVDPSFGGVAL